MDFSKAQAIQEMPIMSVICDPQPGDTVKLDSNGLVRLRGLIHFFISPDYLFIRIDE